MRTGQTPLEVFHSNWQSEHQKKLKRQKVEKDKEPDESGSEDDEHDYGNLPKIKPSKAKKIRTDGQVELFPSDEEDDGAIDFDADSDNSFEDDNSEDEVPKKKGKQQTNGKANKKPDSEDEASSDGEAADESFLDKGDIVEELTDW